MYVLQPLMMNESTKSLQIYAHDAAICELGNVTYQASRGGSFHKMGYNKVV